MEGKAIAGIIAVVVVIALVGLGVWWVVSYNGMVSENEEIDAAWAEVTNKYQYKIDLIPQLADAVSGYQMFESSTITNITELRGRWMNATTAEEQVNLTNQLDAQLATIIVTYEAYPELQSVYLVSSFMFSLEGAETEISVARMRYNEAVRDYNAHIKSFPASMVAGSGGFEEREYYLSEAAPPAP